MNNNINYKEANSNYSFKDDEDISLKSIYNFLLRNKKLISSFSIIFFLFSIVYSITLKRIWEGQFQIVLNPESSKSSLNLNNSFRNLLQSPQKGNLKTQVGILESPSVLMPIFNFVANEKSSYSNNKKLIFSKWEKKLNIELEKDTSILNISYEDTDKEIILPVLNKITIAYQEYSGRKKRRNQQLMRNYLLNQIELFKEKSSNSLRLAQKFAIEQDLFYLENSNYQNINQTQQNLLNGSSKDMSIIPEGGNLILPNIQIENVRVQAANDIRRIDLQLKKISELGDDVEKLQYIGSTIPALVKEGLPRELANIEKELVELRSNFTDSDPLIKRVVEKRDLLIKLLKNRSIGYLKAKKVEVEAVMEAAMRPKGVLLKYKELIREASRDESTLVSLENELRIAQLEEAKKEDPWELITKPTLSRIPVGPSKKIIAMVGLLFGTSIGILTAYLREKKSDIVYSFDKLKEVLNTKYHEFISWEDIKFKNSRVLIIREFINSNSDEEIKIITLGKIEAEKIELIKESFLAENKFKIINAFDEIKQINNSDLKILLLEDKKISYSELDTLKKYFKFYELCLDGFILIEGKMEI